jgi:hypothetical protein
MEPRGGGNWEKCRCKKSQGKDWPGVMETVIHFVSK